MCVLLGLRKGHGFNVLFLIPNTCDSGTSSRWLSPITIVQTKLAMSPCLLGSGHVLSPLGSYLDFFSPQTLTDFMGVGFSPGTSPSLMMMKETEKNTEKGGLEGALHTGSLGHEGTMAWWAGGAEAGPCSLHTHIHREQEGGS